MPGFPQTKKSQPANTGSTHTRDIYIIYYLRREREREREREKETKIDENRGIEIDR